MSGWDVMAGPLAAVLRVAVAGWLVLWVSMGWSRRRRIGAVRTIDLTGRRRAAMSASRPVTDTAIVAAYNDALLAGLRAGEGATFERVAERVGTSTDHVRTVIARHWAA